MLDKYFPLYVIIFILSLLITVTIEKKLIPILSKSAKQPIYTDGPKWHSKKSGTPTMGGVAFIISVVISFLFAGLVLFNKETSNMVLSLIISLSFALLNSLVGIIDDLKKLKKKENLGLTAKQKLLLQFLIATLFLIARRFFLSDNTVVYFSFGEFDLGAFYYPLSLVLIVGIINCANLTDGIDGLASSVAFGIGISFLYISAALNTSSAIVATTIIGASIGFLVFNLHPAKIFMGDTGSLFFGALVTSCAFELQNPTLIIPIAGVYVIEGCSVILQVIWYKLFKKRIFKMAPLHHHLERCGWSENKICIVAILSTFIFSIPAYIFYLP